MTRHGHHATRAMRRNHRVRKMRPARGDATRSHSSRAADLTIRYARALKLA